MKNFVIVILMCFNIFVSLFYTVKLKRIKQDIILYRVLMKDKWKKLKNIEIYKINGRGHLKIDSLCKSGEFLIIIVSPRDCGACLNAEVSFLERLNEKINIRRIIIVNIKRSVITNFEEWIEDWMKYGEVFLDTSATVEKSYNLRHTKVWNLVVKDGTILKIFEPPSNEKKMQFWLSILKILQ